MPGPIARHAPITANTECGIGVGHVHTVIGTDRFFVQVTVGTTLLNKYLNVGDEEKVWIRGHDVEKMQTIVNADLAAEAMQK